MLITKQFDRLEQSRLELIYKVIELSNQTMYLHPKPGKWSIAQILEHVRVSEKQITNGIIRKLNSGEVFKEAGLRADFAILATKFIYATRIPLKAPSFVANIAEKPDLEHLYGDWNEMRNKLRDIIHSFPGDLKDKLIFTHPILGPLSMRHILQFMYSHFKVHEKQVKKIISSVR